MCVVSVRRCGLCVFDLDLEWEKICSFNLRVKVELFCLCIKLLMMMVVFCLCINILYFVCVLIEYVMKLNVENVFVLLLCDYWFFIYYSVVCIV